MIDKDTEHEDWNYPDIDNDMDDQFVDLGSLTDDAETPPKPKVNVDEIIEQNNILMTELTELREKYTYIESISSSVFGSLLQAKSYINDEIIDLIKSTIKTISEKIIRNELRQDPQLFIQIIDKLTASIDYNGGTVAVIVSKIDHQKLIELNHPLKDAVKLDENLEMGDVIIKSNNCEINSIINESLNELLR